MAIDTTTIKSLILKRLNQDTEKMKQQFQESLKVVGTKFLAIDDLLPPEITENIFNAFNFSSPEWREMNSFRERKLTTKKYDAFDPLLAEITFAFQDPEVIALVEKITGIVQQVGDPGLYAGGLSAMRPGDFLDPHIDNSHDQERKVYRRLNLLFYVTPNWKPEDGGNLELWNDDVTEKVTVESRFNRLVLMETHHRSWHSVSAVTKPNGKRCCVSNYYFSPVSPLDHDYFHVTSFNGRPEAPLKRIICKVDNLARMTLRKFKGSGFGKKDVYTGPQGK